MTTKSKSEVILLHDYFRVVFNGVLTRPQWLSKGAASAALDLLRKGKGTVNDSRDIVWKIEKEGK